MKTITIASEKGEKEIVVPVVIPVKDPIKIIKYAGLKEDVNEETGIVEKEPSGIEFTVIMIGPPNITKVCIETLEPIINQMLNT